jgi:hypothetical protein
MNLSKFLMVSILVFTVAGLVWTQNGSRGSIHGKVRVENGSASGVTVTVSSGERSIAHAETNRKGEFTFTDIEPGAYELTFRKPGLSVGKLENVEVRSGKSNDLGDRLIMRVDEGSLAFIEGSVFAPSGRSVPGARVDVMKISPDGSSKKLESKFTDDTGQFAFRLSPASAKYRVTVKVDGADPVSRDVDVDGASVYRIALNLLPKK